MKVSIITVTYNSGKYLEDCIKSVIKQSHHNIEHIIIDGKSTDNTLDIIKKYKSHIAKNISETDRGIYDAINKGMAMATGDIIGNLNSDDILVDDDVIESIVKAFEENNVETVYGDLEYVSASDTNKIMRIWKGKSYKRSRFRYGWMPAHPTFYIKRSLVENYGFYQNHYYTAADYEFMARYLYKNKVSSFYLPKLIVKMRMGGQSNKNMHHRFRANRRDFLAMKKNDIPFAFFVSILKPLIKLNQFFKK
ncbi:MAG: glycosyltransferase family 2 protein [Ferruginibacter sp.]